MKGCCSQGPPSPPKCPFLTPGQCWVALCLTKWSGDKCEAWDVSSSPFLCSFHHPFIPRSLHGYRQPPPAALKAALWDTRQVWPWYATSSWKWHHQDPLRWSKWAQVHKVPWPQIWKAPREAPSARWSALLICNGHWPTRFILLNSQWRPSSNQPATREPSPYLPRSPRCHGK